MLNLHGKLQFRSSVPEREDADLLERDFLVAKIFEQPPAFPPERRRDGSKKLLQGERPKGSPSAER